MTIISALAALSPVSVTQAPSSAPIDEGLTMADVIHSLPMDPASITVLLLLVGFVASVVWFGTRGGGGGSAGSVTRVGPEVGGGVAPGPT